MKEPKFYLKDGSLSAYSFACGKVQKEGDVSMWKEHCMYHISRKSPDGDYRWESTESLKEARKMFRAAVRKAKQEPSA